MATKALTAAILAATLLAGCVDTSDPMPTEDGSFIITGSAGAYGSQAGAMGSVQEAAQKFCAQQGKRAVAVTAAHQEGATGGLLFANHGGLSGGAFPMRYDADLQFRCV